MLRTVVAVVAAICAAGLIGTPAANAAPKFCDSPRHNIYIHACAGGDGGPGPMMGYKDTNGKWHFMRQKDYDQMLRDQRRHQN